MRASGAKQMSRKCHSAQNFLEPRLLTQPPPRIRVLAWLARTGDNGGTGTGQTEAPLLGQKRAPVPDFPMMHCSPFRPHRFQIVLIYSVMSTAPKRGDTLAKTREEIWTSGPPGPTLGSPILTREPDPDPGARSELTNSQESMGSGWATGGTPTSPR